MKEFESICCNAARRQYGEAIPKIIENRLKRELHAIDRNGYSDYYLTAQIVVNKTISEGKMIRTRGSVGASLVAYFLGISEVNPLPPHYLCRICHTTNWGEMDRDRRISGVDLPQMRCPNCENAMVGEGHQIPCETFLGGNMKKAPKIDFYVAYEFKETVEAYLQSETNRLGLQQVVAPRFLQQDNLSVLQLLHKLTGMDPRAIDMNDSKVLSLFSSTKELGVDPAQILTEAATYSIPEMGPSFVREMLEMTQPANFTDLLQVTGLSHGNGAWEGNARPLLSSGVCSLRDVIGCRDDIFLKLISHGLDRDFALSIAELVRSGETIPELHVEHMRQSGIPEWYIESYARIKYLFPKAHAVENVIAAIRNAYYKLYYPLEFYAANFIVRGRETDIDCCARSYEAILREVVQDRDDVEPRTGNKKSDVVKILNELALEMTARGYSLNKNSGGEYSVEGHGRSVRITES